MLALAAIALAAALAAGCRGAPDLDEPAPEPAPARRPPAPATAPANPAPASPTPAPAPAAPRPAPVPEAKGVVVVRRSRLVAEGGRAADPTGVTREDLFAGPGSSTHAIRVRTRVPLHIHERHDETVIVLKGAGRLTYGQGFGKLVPRADVDLFAGDVVFVPRGTMHGFVNMLEMGEETTVISVFSPAFDGVDRVYVDGK